MGSSESRASFLRRLREAVGVSSARREGGEGPRFWREIYWFAVINVLGLFIALAVVPPKAKRYWSLLQLEADLAVREARIERRIEILKAATWSMESDPFYREAVFRTILGVKKNSEEYLQADGPAVR